MSGSPLGCRLPPCGSTVTITLLARSTLGGSLQPSGEPLMSIPLG